MFNTSRNCTSFYVLYLIPHKNLLTIDLIKKCSTTKKASFNLSTLNRYFRTRAQQSSSSSGLGYNSSQNSINNQSDENKDKKFTLFQLFNFNKDNEKLKKMLDQTKLNQDEKGQIKVN